MVRISSKEASPPKPTTGMPTLWDTSWSTATSNPWYVPSLLTDWISNSPAPMRSISFAKPTTSAEITFWPFRATTCSFPQNEYFKSMQTAIVDFPNRSLASRTKDGVSAATVPKTTRSAPASKSCLISSKDLIPPPTENGILASSPTFRTKSIGIQRFSLVALISNNMSSSALNSLNKWTACSGSPIYLGEEKPMVLTKSPPWISKQGINLGRYMTG